MGYAVQLGYDTPALVVIGLAVGLACGGINGLLVTGLGLPSEMRDFIKDGTVKAFQLWSPYNEGWLAAHFAKGVLEGSIKNEVGSTFEVPNLGTITINANNSINTQAELTTFTPENIDEFNF